jgi:hypothetical protein
MGLGDRLAGDVDYGRFGEGYVTRRRTDPRIARLILSALGLSRTVLNVGAGAGSNEPADRDVAAAGLYTVAVPHPLTRDLDLSAADLVLDSLVALPLADAVERAWRRSPSVPAGPEPGAVSRSMPGCC